MRKIKSQGERLRKGPPYRAPPRPSDARTGNGQQCTRECTSGAVPGGGGSSCRVSTDGGTGAVFLVLEAEDL